MGLPKKRTNNPKGRPAGSENKITGELRERIKNFLEGNFEILEGNTRTPIGSIGGNQVQKLTWLIKTEKKAEISAKLESAVFSEKVKQIKIGG